MNNLNCYLYTIQWVTSTKNVAFGWNGFFFPLCVKQIEYHITAGDKCDQSLSLLYVIWTYASWSVQFFYIFIQTEILVDLAI